MAEHNRSPSPDAYGAALIIAVAVAFLAVAAVWGAIWIVGRWL